MPTTRAIHHIRDLKPGDHACLIYETDDEHRSVVSGYVQQGLERDQKVLYAGDGALPDHILSGLGDLGVDVDRYSASGQLVTAESEDIFLRNGRFDPEVVIGILEGEIETALGQGYSALRVTGDMSWIMRAGDLSDRLIEHSSSIHSFVLNTLCLAMCQYDRREFPAKVLLDVLRAHPIAIVGGRVCRNSYYVPPDELLGTDASGADLQHFVDGLTERKRLDEEREAAVELLRLINSVDKPQELMTVVAELLRDWSGCEGVGIKLLVADRPRYVAASGIPEDIVAAAGAVPETESDGLDGALRRCACRDVLKEDYDPLLPHFTDRGSFWTNSVREALGAGSLASGCRCSEGSESMALVPIRSAGETFGLLQLHAKRAGHFTPDLISFMERVADSLAIAFRERRAQEDLRASRERLNSVTQASPDYIMLLAPDLTVQFMNRTEPGLSPEDVLGRHICEFARDEEKEAIREKLEQALAGQAPYHFVHACRRNSVRFAVSCDDLGTGELMFVDRSKPRRHVRVSELLGS